MVNCNYISFGEPGPFSDIVEVNGNLLFLSGLVSEDFESGEVIRGGITAETRQTLTNLKNILEQNGSDMAHVIRVDVMLNDFSERDEMNAEYVKHFPADRMPARVCFGGVDLAAGLKIEMTVIAAKK